MREDLNFLVGCISLSQSANVVLPTRIGDMTRAYLLKKIKDIPLTTALSSLAVERIFDILAITMIGGFAAAVLDHIVKNSVTLVIGSAYLSHFGLSWSRLVG